MRTYLLTRPLLNIQLSKFQDKFELAGQTLEIKLIHYTRNYVLGRQLQPEI